MSYAKSAFVFLAVLGNSQEVISYSERALQAPSAVGEAVVTGHLRAHVPDMPSDNAKSLVNDLTGVVKSPQIPLGWAEYISGLVEQVWTSWCFSHQLFCSAELEDLEDTSENSVPLTPSAATLLTPFKEEQPGLSESSQDPTKSPPTEFSTDPSAGHTEIASNPPDTAASGDNPNEDGEQIQSLSSKIWQLQEVLCGEECKAAILSPLRAVGGASIILLKVIIPVVFFGFFSRQILYEDYALWRYRY